MTASAHVEPCSVDRGDRWFRTGHDGAWPERRCDGRRASLNPLPGNQIAGSSGSGASIRRSGRISRQHQQALAAPGATPKSP